MISLNDYLEYYLVGMQGHYDRKDISVDRDLSPDMPQCYDDSADNTRAGIMQVLIELGGEVMDLKAVSRVLFQTKYNGRVQFLNISSDAKRIPSDKLGPLNQMLEQVARGEHPEGRITGNRKAAVHARHYGGRIRLENLSDGEYSVGTVVEIPDSCD